MSDETHTITGRITHILPVEEGESSNGLWKRGGFVIETGGKYPTPVQFDLWGDKLDTVEVSEGQTVTVAYNPKSREYAGKWYTNLSAWRVDVEEAQELPSPDKSEWDDDGSLPF